jgi:hypothetical protein
VNLNFILAPPFMGFAKIPAEIAYPATEQNSHFSGGQNPLSWTHFCEKTEDQSRKCTGNFEQISRKFVIAVSHFKPDQISPLGKRNASAP